MDSDLFEYAVAGLKMKKKITIPVFLVLCVSFSFLIFINSLMGSITKTNDEFLKNLYGEWNIGLPDGRTSDKKWAEGYEGYIEGGTSKNYGFVSVNKKLIGFGTVDEELIDVGRLGLTAGRWPEKEFEIAMEADELLALGYLDETGQTVSLATFLYNNASSEEIYYKHKYTVVGIIKEYTDIWASDAGDNTGLLNAVITTDETIKQIQNLINDGENEKIILKNKVGFFMKFEKEKTQTIRDDLEKLGRKYIYNKNSEILIENNNILYSIIIIIVTVAAVSIVYMLGLSDMVRSYSVMRSIGATRKQLAKLMMYETVILCVPAVIPGTIFAVLALTLTLKMIVFSGSVKIILSIPWLAIFGEVLLWSGAVAATKYCIYIVACKNDLTGKMQLAQKKAGVYRSLKNAAVYFICICFGIITIYLGIGTEKLIVDRNKENSLATYRIVALDYSVVPTDALEKIKKIPGIKDTYGCYRYIIEYAEDYGYPGAEMLYVTEDAGYTEREFEKQGIDIEGFVNGDLIIVCVPVSEKEDHVIATGKEKLKVFAGVNKMGASPLLLNGDIETTVEVCYVPETMYIRDGLADIPGWTFASYAFLEKHDLLARKDKVGYFIYAYYDGQADAVTVDRTVAALCKENNLFFTSYRAQNEAGTRIVLQRLLKLLFVGGGIEAVTLFLMCSLSALERQSMTKKYMILRSLGMSQRQWRYHNLFEAFICGTVSFIGGWGLYAILYKKYLKVFLIAYENAVNICACISVVILLLSVVIRYCFEANKNKPTFLMNE